MTTSQHPWRWRWINIKVPDHEFGTWIARRYRASDPIWELDPDERDRKVIADVQRDLRTVT